MQLAVDALRKTCQRRSKALERLQSDVHVHVHKNGKRVLHGAGDRNAPLPQYSTTESRGSCGGFRFTQQTWWVMIKLVGNGGVAHSHVGELMQIVLTGFGLCELTRCSSGRCTHAGAHARMCMHSAVP